MFRSVAHVSMHVRHTVVLYRHACMYACTHACDYVSICVGHMHICNADRHVRTYVCKHVRTYARTYVCMEACMHVRMYVCVCVCAWRPLAFYGQVGFIAKLRDTSVGASR